MTFFDFMKKVRVLIDEELKKNVDKMREKDKSFHGEGEIGF